MEVRAKEKGFYGGIIREPGDKFELKKGDKLGRWMEPVKAAKAAPKEPEPKDEKVEEQAPGDGPPSGDQNVI